MPSIGIHLNIFLPNLENQFSKKGKFQPVAEHRLTAIHLPLLNVSREKISSHSGLKSRVAKILCSFCVSMEGEYILGLFSVVWTKELTTVWLMTRTAVRRMRAACDNKRLCYWKNYVRKKYLVWCERGIIMPPCCQTVKNKLVLL